MPNKTIYVSEDDLPLFERAQAMAGDDLPLCHSPRAAPLHRDRGSQAEDEESRCSLVRPAISGGSDSSECAL